VQKAVDGEEPLDEPLDEALDAIGVLRASKCIQSVSQRRYGREESVT